MLFVQTETLYRPYRSILQLFATDPLAKKQKLTLKDLLQKKKMWTDYNINYSKFHKLKTQVVYVYI